jgi:recombination protein RecA
MPQAARAQLESLLRARKLDVTLTSAVSWRVVPDEALASTGVVALDRALGGGLRRGHLSEIIGARGTGRTTLLCDVLAAATARGEAVALVDTHDRFDPSSAVDAGVDLTRLLWIRPAIADAGRSIKAMNLILQAGGFGVVALDVADLGRAAARQFPFTTWMRLARVIEGSHTVALIVAAERLGRSPGGATIALDAPAHGTRGKWTGRTDRARLLRGIDIAPRIVACHM